MMKSLIRLLLFHLLASLVHSSKVLGTLERDFTIIGGGSAGTYTAIRLQQLGYTVALIERNGRLGGQVNSYTDPQTNISVDYGVKLLSNTSLVKGYFASLDTPLAPFEGFVAHPTSAFAELSSGRSVPPVLTGNATEGLQKYAALVAQYDFLATGWHIPDPVPEELLIPFGDWIQQHNLSAAFETIYGVLGAPGNILAQTTMYMLKNFGVTVEQITGGGYLTEAHDRLQTVYDNALQLLHRNSSAFLSSKVHRVHRTNKSVETTLTTPHGVGRISSRKLVVAIPQTLDNLRPFLDLSHDEQAVFGKFNASYIWASLVRNSGIAASASLLNVDPTALLGVPPMPAVFNTQPTPLEDLHIVWYGSPYAMPNHKVADNILEAFQRYRKANGGDNGTAPEIVELRNHGPYELAVSPKEIQAGFYDRLNALQGSSNTFWNGAALETYVSSFIWNFTEVELLPKIVASL